MPFQTRTHCPVCSTTWQQSQVLVDLPFDSGVIADYLNSFYAPQGGVDFEYLKDGSYQLVRCHSCDLIFQAQILGDEGMELLYEHWIDPETIFNTVAQQHPPSHYLGLSRQIRTILRTSAQRPRETKVLDYSAGWGEWCQLAAGHGLDVTATEYSAARRRHLEKLGIPVVDQDDLPEQDFHFINAEQVFEHLPDPEKTLSLLAQALNDQGVLHLAVPNGKGIEQRLQNAKWTSPKGSNQSLNAVAPLEHINCFQEEVIVTLAQRCGLVRLPSRPREMPQGLLAKSKARLRNLAKQRLNLVDAPEPDQIPHPFPNTGCRLLFAKSEDVQWISGV